MSEKDLFEEMLNNYLPEEKKSGDLVEAVIVRKDNEFGYLDLNAKQEGRILLREIEDYNIGDTIEVKVLRNDDKNIIVSKFLLDKAKEFATLVEGEIITGTISKKVKGGYSVKIGKNEAFLPFSLSSFDRNQDYIGKTYKFVIHEKTKNNVTISRSDLVKREEEEYFNSKKVNDVVNGKIKEILDFGIVVDLGLTTGFLHISEISWDQTWDINEKFKVGEEIKVKIIEKDEDKKKIKLSIKQLESDPYIVFRDHHRIGDVVDAEVKEILDFGIIVDLGNVSGFIHISEISWNNPAKSLREYNEKDKLKAAILSFDDDKKSIKLSIKKLIGNPWEKVRESYKIGDILEREIKEIFDFGLSVELEKGIEGLLHVSQLAYRRIFDLQSKYNVGETIKFKIIDFDDEKNRVVLSVRALLDDTWDRIEEIYNLKDIVKGKVINIQDYGIFLEDERGLEIFIHKNEYSWDRNIKKEYSIGEDVEFKIILLDKNERKLSGSIKQLTKSPWKEAGEQFKVGNKVSVKIVEKAENFVLVKLTERFNGIIPNRELEDGVEYKVGDIVEAVVVEKNEKRKSIALSIKRIKEREEERELEELMKIYGV